MFKPATTKPVFQLLVTLRAVDPSVWRRLEVEDCCLSTLHRIIQAAMGWQDCHMHCFEIGDQKYTNDEAIGDLGWSNGDSTKLGEIVADGYDSFIYTYDMGDRWDHTVKVEKSGTGKPSARYPRCTGGKRTCPPEDCGGVPGYGASERLGSSQRAMGGNAASKPEPRHAPCTSRTSASSGPTAAP